MKNTGILSIALFLLVTIGCEDTTEPTTHIISVAIDQTGAIGFQLRSELVLGTLHKTDWNDGIELSLIPITDIRYHSKQSFVLEKGATGWMANENERRNQRRHLFQRFEDSLAMLNANSKELQRSDIFRVVVKELNVLAVKTGKRQLIISSDLKEHNGMFSVYAVTQLQILYDNPREVVRTFESSVNLANDLSGISIHIVYLPTLQDEELFSRLVAVYKSILEPRGATITVGQHNTISI